MGGALRIVFMALKIERRRNLQTEAEKRKWIRGNFLWAKPDELFMR